MSGHSSWLLPAAVLHPPGAAGPQNGYDRVHGVFRIPFDQFVDFFTFLAIEES
jgi:hypothetical protein